MKQDAEAKNASKKLGKNWQKSSMAVDADGNIDVKKFKPTSNELLTMTPK